MGRKRTTPHQGPATGKPLPDGVMYRGPSQYRARERVNGQQITKSVSTARFASRWLAEIQVDSDRDLFVDRSAAERATLGEIIQRYRNEVHGEDSEKRGAEKESGHLSVVLEDPICGIRVAFLASADIAGFRDRMKALEYAPATIVRRLNLLQAVIEDARREWGIHLTANHAQLVKRPAGADRKRNRVFAPPPRDDVSPSDRGIAEIRGRSPSEGLRRGFLLGPITRLVLETAMRQGEIVGLQWPDIHLERRTAVVRGAAGSGRNSGVTWAGAFGRAAAAVPAISPSARCTSSKGMSKIRAAKITNSGKAGSRKGGRNSHKG
jgi:hypothetical protein